MTQMTLWVQRSMPFSKYRLKVASIQDKHNAADIRNHFGIHDQTQVQEDTATKPKKHKPARKRKQKRANTKDYPTVKIHFQKLPKR